MKSNFNLSFNNSFNTSYANGDSAGSALKVTPVVKQLLTRQSNSPDGRSDSIVPTVTISAQTTNAAGKTLISHGPLTIDLTDLEQKISAKVFPLNRQQPRTFEEVIEDGG